MGRRIVVLAAALLMTQQTLAAATAKEMYDAALAREQAIRVTLTDGQAPAPSPAEVHAVIAAYRAIVRRYPASAYSDNALWQAGRLSLDAFARFGDPRDQDMGLRLLQRLATDYPSSSLAARVPEQLGRTGADGPKDLLLPVKAASDPHRNGGKIATINDIRRVVLPDAVRVTIGLDAEVAFHEERISSPDRVFVDLSPTRAVKPLVDQTLRFDGDSDVVRRVRLGRHPNHTTRVVLDANGVSTYSVYALYNPYRLVIDCVRAAPGLQVSSTDEPLVLHAGVMTTDWGRRLPSTLPRGTSAILDALAAPVALPSDERPVATADPAPAASPPAKNLTGRFSIARQLGLGVSRIVIDPGHGGHDPGAMARGGSEAELVLDVALRLEKLLQKVPGVEVVLTRRTDEFVPLQERTAIANREGADLFLSIHANASENHHARGVETYFLNFANNLSAAAVAARENAASGQAMAALPDLVKAIALSNKLDESRDFATFVQRAMVERLRPANKGLRDLGVKQAPFVVLIGAAMPSVLTEISFITDAQDARLLRSSTYRQRIAEALLNGIRRYQASLKNVARVAHQ